MELAEGGTLANKLNTDISKPDARKWAMQLVTVLVHMHEKGVAHRDLKPENVLLSAAGDIKVVKEPLRPPLCCQQLAMRCLSQSWPCVPQARTLPCKFARNRRRGQTHLWMPHSEHGECTFRTCPPDPWGPNVLETRAEASPVHR